MIILGILAIITGIGMALAFAGQFFGYDTLADVGLFVLIAGIVFAILGAGVYLIVNDGKPTALADHCYRAVPHSSTALVPMGKVFIPIEGTSLAYEEITCP